MNQLKVFDSLNKYDVKSVLIGTLLGDSSLQKRATGVRLQGGHSPKVEEYVCFKKSLLEQISGVSVKYKYYNHLNKRLNKIYPSLKVWSNNHELFGDMFPRMYKEGRKTVTKNILNSLTPLGLAIWYMDDGSLILRRNAKRSPADSNIPKERSISSRTINIATYNFTYEENCLISDWLLNVYGIESKVKPSKNKYIIYVNTTNSKKFIDLVRDYVLPVSCMHHKIDFKYTKNNNDLLRYNIEYWLGRNSTSAGHSYKSDDIV